MTPEDFINAKCIQSLKNKMQMRLDSCNAKLKASTAIISQNDEAVEFIGEDGQSHHYFVASATAMANFIGNAKAVSMYDDCTSFLESIDTLKLVQLFKALMEFGSEDIENRELVISYLLHLLSKVELSRF